jgi:hypothetical protein
MDPKYVDHKNQVHFDNISSFYQEILIQRQPVTKNLLPSLASFQKKEWISSVIPKMKLIKKSLKNKVLRVNHIINL